MAVAFLREAASVLKEGGYEQVRHGKHPIWKHPSADKPIIQIPSSPRDPDHALVRLRRAVRVGSTPHIPQGVEKDIVKQQHKTGSAPPLDQVLVGHAPSGLKKRANEVQRTGNTSKRAPHADVATWLRKCLTSHGKLDNAVLNAAAAGLFLNGGHLSAARTAIGAMTFKEREAAGPKDPSYTDFSQRVPENAVRVGRVAGTHNKKNGSRPPVQPVKVILPADPDQERGRPLVGGDLTDEQRSEAQERMRRSTELADAERRAILAEREAAETDDGSELGVRLPDERENANGNGRPKSGMDLAIELLVQEALAATHALTDADIAMLRGTQDNLDRIASDLQGMRAGIANILKRVDQRQAAAA